MHATICLVILDVHIFVLLIIEVKIHMLVKWSYMSPNHVDRFAYQGEHISNTLSNQFLNTCVLLTTLRYTCNRIPLK